MRYELLQSVVLARDVPEHGLRKGDLGTVLERYDPDGVEVEFVTGSGNTQAVLTLTEEDVRLISDDDVIAVRPSDEAR